MDEDRARELLTRERERVERSLAVIATGREDAEELSVWDQHPADFATELFDRELEEGLRPLLEEILAAIKRAEKRLEEGTYGKSIESGEPIPDGRLEVLPWAERTAHEQENYKRRQLGVPPN